jgi:hypothetical protein
MKDNFGDVRTSNGSESLRREGGSYFHEGWELEEKPNNAPRLKDKGKLS